jgi:hypothetical protein
LKIPGIFPSDGPKICVFLFVLQGKISYNEFGYEGFTPYHFRLWGYLEEPPGFALLASKLTVKPGERPRQEIFEKGGGK